MILVVCKGIPAWRTRRILPLILTTGFAEGTGLLMLISPLYDADVIAASLPTLLILTALAIVSRGVAWWRYQQGLREAGAPDKTLEALASARTFVIAAGHLIPLILAGVVSYQLRFGELLLPLAGFMMMIAGWYLKFVIVNRAGFNQGFAIPHSPARGGGEPGPGCKPGWSRS
jgi:phenylacetyl-CoA:acceptor oxidoreductase subunit 2